MEKDFIDLIKISIDENNNRFYRMKRISESVFQIEMGRIGATPVYMKRPMHLWEKTLQEKLKAGYVDRTKYTKIIKKSTHQPIEDPEVRELIKDLLHYANRIIKENYTISIEEVSKEMIEEAHTILYQMSKCTNAYIFNQHLKKLFYVIPRKMSDVQAMLADSVSDFERIIEREEELWEILKNKVAQVEKERISAAGDQKTLLEEWGISIRPCSDSEERQIISHLTPESASYFKRAFRVNNHFTDKQYERYVKEAGAKTHFLYHGSRNTNYIGILTEGLRLHPDAIITGKMFGSGLYFANRAKKSIGYTDTKGSVWAKGKKDQSYLAVYKVAYKHARHIDVWDTSLSLLTKEKLGEYDALFAHKGQSLVNDEIIIYDERQSTIQYLIELQS